MTTTTVADTPAAKSRRRRTRESTALTRVEEAKEAPKVFQQPKMPEAAFEEVDENEDDEDEDEGDDDEPTDPVDARPVPRPSFTPPPFVPGGGRPQNPVVAANEEIRSRKMEAYLAAEDDLQEITEGLEFGNAQHEVKLTRTRSNPPGVSKGYLDSFFRRISVIEIKDLYGGGEFLYTVWGPDASGRRVCKSKKTITIEGLSLVNGLPATGSAAADQNNSAQKDMVRVLLQDKEREANRLFEEIKELKKAQTEFLQRDTVTPVLQVLKETTEKQLAAQREQLEREERRADRERAEKKEEAAKEEKREAERRQEYRERMEAEKLRAASELKIILEMQQQNTAVMIASMKDAASSKEAGFATILNTVQQSSQQQMATLQANFTQQMQMAQQQMTSTIQQMSAFSEQRENLLKDALKEARSSTKGDLTTQLSEFAKLKNTVDVIFNTAAPQAGVVDTIKEFASSPAATALVQSFLGARQPLALPPGTPPGMAGPPVAVGSVQVSGPRELPKGPSPWPTTTGAPPLPKKPVAKARPVPAAPVMAVPPTPGGPSVVLTPPAAPEEAPKEPSPDSLGVTFPQETDTDEQKFEALIRALDAALRADWTTDQMFKLLVPRFPKDVVEKLKDTPLELCLQVVEAMAPNSVLNTALGSQVMRELFTRIGVPQ